MFLLIVFQILVLSSSCQGNEQQTGNPAIEYEVVMYAGFPPESIPEEDRKNLPPEKPLLIALVETDGRFDAKSEGEMLEGTISNEKDGKIGVKIDRSSLGSTSCSKINALVKLGEPVSPKSCAFGSIIFSYYFRVRKRAEQLH
jgi:hypothetical protein